MASRTRSRRAAVGQQKARKSWPWLFTLGVVAVVLSFVVFIAVVAKNLDGSGGPGSAAQGIAPAATPTEAPSTNATQQAPSPASTSATNPSATATPAGASLPCGDILVPLDKEHSLAPDCAPADLEALGSDISAEGAQYMRREAAGAMRELLDAAGRDGYRLYVNSAYRSYATQAQTFSQWVQLYGLQYAERTSARAGHSEHQLGTTADVGFPGHFLEDFTGTAEAKWLAANSWKYGFIVSYPDGKEDITGYAYESWHVRYLGKDAARRVHDSGKTLHEFLLQR